MNLKLILITIALGVTSGYAHTGVGIKGGLSLFKSHNNRPISFFDEPRPAPDISVFCEFEANKFLFHNIQFTYYQAGGKTTIQFTDENGELTGDEGWFAMRLDYIGIGYGLEFKAKFLNLLPYLSAGVSLDYLVNTKEETEIYGTVVENHSFDDSKFKSFNLRPFLTGGLEYKILRFAILAEYTFSFNVLPYFEYEKTETSTGVKYKTFGHFINLGCKIYL